MKWFNNTASNSTTWSDSKSLIVTIISDKRCTACPTKEIWDQLKQVPFLSSATFEQKDFSDVWVSEFLQANKISALPAFVFSTNKIADDWQMQDFLTPLPNGQFNLSVGSKFDPFVKRSEKWFLLLDKQKISEIKKDSYIEWDPNAKITWFEYSDIECPFCAKLHNSGTTQYIEWKYKDSLNRVFQSFPLEFHKNALPAAQILECVWEQWWWKSFYEFAQKAYAKEKSDQVFLLGLVEEMGLDRKKVEVCVDGKTYETKIQKQIDLWKSVFGISATPWNVLLNNDTWEYEIISWAFPKETFEKVVDKLLK